VITSSVSERSRIDSRIFSRSRGTAALLRKKSAKDRVVVDIDGLQDGSPP